MCVCVPTLKSIRGSLLVLNVVKSLRACTLVNIVANNNPGRTARVPNACVFVGNFARDRVKCTYTVSMTILVFTLMLAFVRMEFLNSKSFVGGKRWVVRTMGGGGHLKRESQD